jgi:hypothetical protein
MKKIILTGVTALFLFACNNQPSTYRNEQTEQNQGQDQLSEKDTPAPGKNVKLLKLVKHDVVDHEGLIPSTYLLPENWTVQDKLYWEYRDPTVPIRYKSTLQNGDKTMIIQSYPDTRASWYTGPSGTQGYRPPKDIIAGMKDLIKAERKSINIQYADQKILSNKPQNSYVQGSQTKTLSQSGVIRIEYDENGQRYEEEFYGQLDVTDVVSPSAMGTMESIIWGAGNLYSVKAVKGKLDDCRKIAQTVKSSARLTLPFYNKLSQVIQLLSNQVYRQIYQAGQISKIISQTNDQMLANIDASYRQTEKANDHINQQFSDYIRGVERYSDGESQIQLPSGYSNAWVNDKGEYILTNTEGWNPGTEFMGNWKQLEKSN